MWAGSAAKLESPLGIGGGPVFWYDFGDPLTLYTDAGSTLVSADGQLIYQCNDKAGTNHITQSTSSKRPTYKTNITNGFSIARFDATDDYMVNGAFSALGTASRIGFIVVKPVTTTNRLLSLGDDASGSGMLWGLQPNAAVVVAEGNRVWTTVLSTALQQLLTVESTANTNDSLAWLDSVSLSVSSTVVRALDTLSGLVINANDNNPSPPAGQNGGDYAEILVYSPTLSTYDRKRVENYLMAKWGIGA